LQNHAFLVLIFSTNEYKRGDILIYFVIQTTFLSTFKLSNEKIIEMITDGCGSRSTSRREQRFEVSSILIIVEKSKPKMHVFLAIFTSILLT
jgi:hypothetical protein